jgi:8-oxo-dGTP diphosphatase
MGVRESRNPRASPSGHLEEGESVLAAGVRETFEETGITLDPAVLRHVLSIHQRNPGTSHARIGFAFTPLTWDGEPVNAEPHKHSELVWADPGRLPPDTVDYTPPLSSPRPSAAFPSR